MKPVQSPPSRRATPAPQPGNVGGAPRFATIAAVWGPGLLVMLANTDAGNVVTAAQAGSVWGFRLAPLLLLLTPVLILVQDLAVRIGIYRKCGFGELIRQRFGRPGAAIAAAALVVATLSSLVTEFTGIAGVGELYGVSRWFSLPAAGVTLILAALTGEYRRVERIALLFGLFGMSFLYVAWQSHPAAREIMHDIADQKIYDLGYLYLVAALIGATFNPWMIFYQSSAVSEKRLIHADYNAARWDTIIGACLTQLLTTAVLFAVAALKSDLTGRPLDNVGQISQALTPFLGETTGRLVFSIAVVGAAMAAAIVSSLACAWGLGEVSGLRRSLERESRARYPFLVVYSAWVIGSGALVFFVSDLVWLSIGMQVLNALLLPIVVTLLVIIAAQALPEGARIGGWYLRLVVVLFGIVAAGGLVGAVAGLG
jgi:Mn2+/Fe2+ NRAMP family transporter